MKNFPVMISEDTIVDGENMRGKTFWVSPSTAVAVFVFYTDDKDGKTYVLANKRGSGCPDFVGYWSCPCGYLEYGEGIQEAASRELHEESGLDFDPEWFNLFGINKSLRGKENITFRFWVDASYLEFPINLTDKYSEPNEIAGQRWISLSDVGEYAWAFGHDTLIYKAFAAYSIQISHNDLLY